MNELRVTLEIGPTEKKFAAVAPDWPGLERGATSRAAAVEALRSYRPRYAKVAELAGLGRELATSEDVQVVEEYRGTGSTDFWGISFAFSSIDLLNVSPAELERELTLLRACWQYFDDVRANVSPLMRKGPRGGGRDRDRIVLHTLAVEQDWATKVGVRSLDGSKVIDLEGVTAYRDAYCSAIRASYAAGTAARTWPLRFLIRHSAFHTMDHAWEMQDKDLTLA